MKSRDIVVGYTHSGYPSQRNFLSLLQPTIRYKKCIDMFKLPEHLVYRLAKSSDPLLLNSFQDFGLNRSVDCFHFFNGVSFTRKPWVSTFETYLPRLGRHEHRYARPYVDRIASSSCKTLIAISQCTADIQRRWLQISFPDQAETICAKVQVIHPPQAIEPRLEICSAFAPPPLHAVMVGHQFFSKGGGEILKVFDRLLRDKQDISLTIVSSLRTDNYATQTTQQHVEAARRIIARWPDNITYYPRLPNSEVKRLLRDANLALLLSYAETYGYFVLEAQAAGLPVVTTNIRAFSEINSPDCGWVVNLEIDEYRNAELSGDKLLYAKERVETDLMAILEEILANPSTVLEKGRKALDRIVGMHDPAHAAKQLRSIYEAALG